MEVGDDEYGKQKIFNVYKEIVIDDIREEKTKGRGRKKKDEQAEDTKGS